MINCQACNGSGKSSLSNVSICSSCHRAGQFSEVNEKEIRKTILASRGKNKGSLKANMISSFKSVEASRAYFVWRLARFHGGADTTMPVMAGLAIHGDPFREELNKLAEIIAIENFGTDLGAVNRWKGLL